MSDKNRRALGRGLDAILQSPETDITSKDISGDFVAGAIAEIDSSRRKNKGIVFRMMLCLLIVTITTNQVVLLSETAR